MDIDRNAPLRIAASILRMRVVVTSHGSNYNNRVGYVTGLRICEPNQGDLCVGVRFDAIPGLIEPSETWFAVRELELV